LVDSGASISYSFAGRLQVALLASSIGLEVFLVLVRRSALLPRLQFLNPMWLSGRCLLLLVLLEVDQHSFWFYVWEDAGSLGISATAK